MRARVGPALAVIAMDAPVVIVGAGRVVIAVDAAAAATTAGAKDRAGR